MYLVFRDYEGMMHIIKEDDLVRIRYNGPHCIVYTPDLTVLVRGAIATAEVIREALNTIVAVREAMAAEAKMIEDKKHCTKCKGELGDKVLELDGGERLCEKCALAQPGVVPPDK